MFRTLAHRSRKVSAALIAAAALGGSLLAVTPGHAASEGAPPAKPYGTVTASTGVNERMYPSTDSPSRGVFRYRTQVGPRCRVRAQDIAGNSVWFLLRDRNTWVAAKYIDSRGEVPLCRTLNRTAADQSTEVRNAMG